MKWFALETTSNEKRLYDIYSGDIFFKIVYHNGPINAKSYTLNVYCLEKFNTIKEDLVCMIQSGKIGKTDEPLSYSKIILPLLRNKKIEQISNI